MRTRDKRPSIRFPAAILLLAGLLAALAACHVTPFQRKLPDTVRRVYLPMAINRTAEPGLEEIVTNAFAEQILTDGRLDLVKKSQADAVIRVVIEDYRESSSVFTGDDVEAVREVALTASLALFEPNDLVNPFARANNVVTRYSYGSDYRATFSTIGEDARVNLGAAAGGELLHALMNRVELVKK